MPLVRHVSLVHLWYVASLRTEPIILKFHNSFHNIHGNRHSQESMFTQILKFSPSNSAKKIYRGNVARR